MTGSDGPGRQLFLRTPAGMGPTQFAEQLAKSVTFDLGMVHSPLNQQVPFDPAGLLCRQSRSMFFGHAKYQREPANVLNAQPTKCLTVGELAYLRGKLMLIARYGVGIVSKFRQTSPFMLTPGHQGPTKS